MYEAQEVGDVLAISGFEVSLWDVDYLVSNLRLLPTRQREAIEWCFLEGLREQDAAVKMGVSRTNPVSMYANEGLKKLLCLIEAGALPRFKYDVEDAR